MKYHCDCGSSFTDYEMLLRCQANGHFRKARKYFKVYIREDGSSQLAFENETISLTEHESGALAAVIFHVLERTGHVKETTL